MLSNWYQDPADTFADVPLDTRHHHFKPKLRFPQEWEMTEERRKNLNALRQKQVARDQQLEIEGQLVDGVQQIQQALASKPVEAVIPDMALAGRGGKAAVKAGGKKLAVRR